MSFHLICSSTHPGYKDVQVGQAKNILRSPELSFMSEHDIEKGMKSPFFIGQVAMRSMAKYAGDGAPGTKWGIDMTRFADILRRKKHALGDSYAELDH